MGSRPLVVAHRAGNNAATLSAAEERGVDMVELDVHLFRGRLEVRHAKTFGPLAILWERWYLVRPFAPRRQLVDVLGTVRPETHLLLDLKGPWPQLGRFAREVMRAACPDRPYSVCARNWFLLRPFRGQPNVRVIRSAAGPGALRSLVRRHRHGDGVSLEERLVTRELLADLHAHTPLVLVWGVVSRDRFRELRDVGVDGFILDDLTLAEGSDG
jgi:glycerophosphoryl diester phosphodiesterase